MNNPFANSSCPTKPPSSFISRAEFFELYSAAAFAWEFQLPTSTHITLNWRKLSCFNPDAVKAAFTAFSKCIRDWFAQRRIPAIYIFAHENSIRGGLHTHFAVHVPRDYRRHFLPYLQDWVIRRLGKPVSGALRTRGTSDLNPITMWQIFSYIVKGYDREVVLISPQNDKHGRGLRLGDIIAVPWQDPGYVPLPHRVGVSPAISAGQRELGYPLGGEELFAPQRKPPANWNLFAVPHPEHLRAYGTYQGGEGVVETLQMRARPPARPFRSKLEDGFYDVRELYPPAFYEWVTRLVHPDHDSSARATKD